MCDSGDASRRPYSQAKTQDGGHPSQVIHLTLMGEVYYLQFIFIRVHCTYYRSQVSVEAIYICTYIYILTCFISDYSAWPLDRNSN